MAYDGDAAGQDATLRSISVLVEQNIDVYVAPLGDGDDPDSFLKANGPDAFRELLDSAEPFFPFLLKRLSNQLDLSSPHSQQAVCDRVFPLLNRFDSEILRGGYLDQLARYMSIEPERLSRDFSQYRNQHVSTPQRKAVSTGVAPAPVRISPAEKQFLAMLSRDDTSIEFALNNLDISYIEHPIVHDIIKNIYDIYRKNVWQSIEVFLSLITDEEAAIITTSLAQIPETPEDKRMKALLDCKKALHIDSWRKEIKRLDEERSKLPPEQHKEITKRIHSYELMIKSENRITKFDFQKTV